MKKLSAKPFSLGWYLYLSLIPIGLSILYFCFRDNDIYSKLTIIFIFSIIEFIFLRIYKFSLKSVKTFNYNYFNELPFYLCNFSNIVAIFAANSNNKILMAYCFCSGTLGAFLALIMPDPAFVDLPFICKQSVGFFGYHVLLVILCLSFVVLGLYNPSIKDIPYVLLIIFIYLNFVHIVNFLLRITGLCKNANYVFTYSGDDNFILKKAQSLIPHKLIFLYPFILIFGIINLIYVLIYNLIF